MKETTAKTKASIIADVCIQLILFRAEIKLTNTDKEEIKVINNYADIIYKIFEDNLIFKDDVDSITKCLIKLRDETNR